MDNKHFYDRFDFLLQMIKISHELYCRKKILDSAKSTAKSSKQMARKLIPGIFTKAAQMSCTLSGQSVRSQGAERRNEATKTLNVDAVRAIISQYSQKIFIIEYFLKFYHKIILSSDYSQNYKNKDGWRVTEADIRRGMSTKLTEQKTFFRENPGATL